jgi:DNA (cytosine-5)-methyltransferase 1
MQGFPESFKPHPKTNLAYKQFGDSVSVPVIEAIYRNIKVSLSKIQ